MVGLLSPADPAEEAALFEGLPVEVLRPMRRDPDGVSAVVADVDILVADWSGRLLPTTSDITGARWLAFVQKPGSGVDMFDLAAFDRAAIPLANTRGTTAASMSEWCLGAAITLARRIADADTWVRNDEWPQLELASRGAVELASQRVGVIGFGPIGQHCAQRFAALGCQVAFWSRRQRLDHETGGVPWRPLDELLAESNVIVVAVALTDETRHLLDRRRLALLPTGAFVINVARGPIIDESALIEGLTTNHLAGAALDVFEHEPLPPTSPLRRLDRVLLSPHSSANTPQSRARMLAAVRDNLSRAIEGEDVQSVVNNAPSRVRRRR